MVLQFRKKDHEGLKFSCSSGDNQEGTVCRKIHKQDLVTVLRGREREESRTSTLWLG